MRIILLLLALLSSPLIAQPRVLVSIAPQKYLVQRIAQNHLTVDVIVPDGASPHSYEPSPKQTLALQEGLVWFRIGENFEQRLIPLFSKKMEIVDQRDGINLIPSSGCCHCHCDAHDSHIWLSPLLLKKEAQQITYTLNQKFPELASFFSHNLLQLSQELDTLDLEISSLLQDKEGSAMLVSHPAFGYFCRDYGLRQISIEEEGKEPSTKKLLALIEEARACDVHAVFLQRQYSMKGGERIAKELQANVVMVDPYQEDVISNLKFLAKTLSL